MRPIITHETIIAFAKTSFINIGICVLYFAAAVLMIKGMNMLIDKLFSKIYGASDSYEFKKQAATVKNLIKSIADWIISAIAVLSLLAKFNIDIRPLLAAAGVVGVAVGFASRRFVEDIIMGILILLEGQLRVGDVVTIDNFSGTVEKISLKMVIIRNMKGHVHYIRNGMINVITNKTREFACPLIDIGVSYSSDIDKVLSVVKSVADGMRNDDKYAPYILADAEILGVDKFEDSAIIIRLSMRTNAIHQWYIEREFNRLIKMAFDREGIEIPFPQRDVHLIKEG